MEEEKRHTGKAGELQPAQTAADAGNSDTEPGRKKQPTAEQYLYAMIRIADWVPEPYKQLAERCAAAGDKEALKELYLCACDGIPAKKAEEALGKAPAEGALRFLRRKQPAAVVKKETKDQKEETESLKVAAARMEKEILELSEAVKGIADSIQGKEVPFPDPELFPPETPETLGTLETPESAGLPRKGQAADVPESGTQEGQEIPAATEQPGRAAKERRAVPLAEGWKSLLAGIRRKREKTIPEYLADRMEEGYSQEQISYLLDCLEEGLTAAEIQKFASPKLPVDLMQRLRLMEEKKAEGQTRG